jgi:thymidylate synthase (FAD)
MLTDPEIHKIPPFGEVVLIDSVGDDLTVVNAARVSFGAKSDSLEDRDKGLIKFLMREKHASPFEHVVFQFYIKCPIFVAREWMRHRWASYNEFSMRYASPTELEFWTPQDADWRKQVGKPGAYTFEPIESALAKGVAEHDMKEVYEFALHRYNVMVSNGIAREIARAVLPVGMYTQFYFTVNARSLINFMSLRNDSAAQKEIQHFASKIEEIFAQKMPVTYTSFIEAGRSAV